VLLRIVAQYADMWNSTGSAEQMSELIEILKRHGDRVKARSWRGREDRDDATLLQGR